MTVIRPWPRKDRRKNVFGACLSIAQRLESKALHFLASLAARFADVIWNVYIRCIPTERGLRNNVIRRTADFEAHILPVWH